MVTLDIAGDAQRVFETVEAGGIATFPNDVGYAVMGASPQALQTIFDTKKRGGHKRHASLCSAETQREIHVLGSREQEILETRPTQPARSSPTLPGGIMSVAACCRAGASRSDAVRWRRRTTRRCSCRCRCCPNRCRCRRPWDRVQGLER